MLVTNLLLVLNAIQLGLIYLHLKGVDIKDVKKEAKKVIKKPKGFIVDGLSDKDKLDMFIDKLNK